MMKLDYSEFMGITIRCYSLNTVIVGSGAAGLNAADRLYNFGQKDIAIVTEGMNKGTSRNTGSDKQTYFKNSLTAKSSDSIHATAESLFLGGAMDGDIALVEAALSAQCFYKLVDIGVAFPHTVYGEYVGYKTDHDPSNRGSSVGPLTSKMITECLEHQIRNKDITVFNGYQVIAVLKDTVSDKAAGLLALDLNNLEDKQNRYVVFNCTNIIYAVGGPAGIYSTSVYPDSQYGASGIAFEAGVKGKNLTESQYGIASTKFKWNLSGTYQQVLPRYVSMEPDGSDVREFLTEYFEHPSDMLNAVFFKGYQWPFDSRKIKNYGSSIIDILVYNETAIKNRKVYLDYRTNPWKEKEFDFSSLCGEAYGYLSNSGALYGNPIDRLLHMNAPAYELYKTNGIDLKSEMLEIAICAQHNNGGLAGDIWWQSNVPHFFPVGEVNGSHGIYRPGGTALNSGQVGSTRAAEYIAAVYKEEPPAMKEFLSICCDQLEDKIHLAEKWITNSSKESNVMKRREALQRRMSQYGAHIRSKEGIAGIIHTAKEELDHIDSDIIIKSVKELPEAFRNRDLLITQYVYCCAILDYMETWGDSRGACIIYDGQGELPLHKLPEVFRFRLSVDEHKDLIQETCYRNGKCTFNWRLVKPIPGEEEWFEHVWKKFRNGEIVR